MGMVELGAIGELVGGVAVLFTLLYLGAQVRQGAQLARGAATREVLTGFHRALDGLAEHRAEFVTGLHRFDGLTRAEQWRFAFLISPLVMALEQTLRMHREGLETADTVEANGGVVVAMLLEAGGRQWWEAAKSYYREFDVFEYIESRLHATGSSPVPISRGAPWFEADDPSAAPTAS